MATPSPFETQSAGIGIGDLPSDHPAFEQYRKLKQAQTLSMQQHQQYAEGLQQKQQMVNMKAGDLSIADRLLKILDPNVNKAARTFLLRELAQNVNVDPKSDNFRAVSQMITALDPNTLGGVKGVIMGNLQTAEPGQVAELATGILSGRVPLNDLMGEVSKLTRAQALTQPMQAGSASPNAAAAPQQGGASQQAGSTGTPSPMQAVPMGAEQPAQAGGVMSFKEKRTFQPQAERINPQLQAELGLDSKKELRNQDLLSNGYTIPLDPKQQAEVASELAHRTPDMARTFRDVGNLTQAIRDTGSSESYRTTGQRVVGMLSSRPGFVNSSGSGSEGWAAVEQLAQQKATTLVKTGDPEAIRNTTNTLLSLSYMQALGGNIPGNKLTNGVLAQNINGINNLSDMYGAAQGSLDASLREYDQYTRANTGQSGLTVMFNKSQDKMTLMSDLAQSAEVLSPETRQEVISIGERLKAGQPISPAIEPASPTMGEERSTLGGLEVTEEKGQIAEREQRMDLGRKADVRAEESGKRDQERLDMATAREERMTKAQESNASLEREKFNWQKQKFAEQQSAEKGEKIAKAFQNFGAAIAGSVKGFSVGGGGSSGGGQSVEAFKITPAPQRQPPRSQITPIPMELVTGSGKGK